MNDKEKDVMSMYDATRAPDFVGEASTTNHLAWSLLVIVVGLMLWLGVALSNAENQRHAMLTRMCQDRVFPAELDHGCLAAVDSRQHWWQHVLYAMTHLGD